MNMEYNITNVKEKYNFTDGSEFFKRFNYYFKYTHLWKSFRNASKHDLEFYMPDVILVESQPRDVLCIKGMIHTVWTIKPGLKKDGNEDFNRAKHRQKKGYDNGKSPIIVYFYKPA